MGAKQSRQNGHSGTDLETGVSKKGAETGKSGDVISTGLTVVDSVELLERDDNAAGVGTESATADSAEESKKIVTEKSDNIQPEHDASAQSLPEASTNEPSFIASAVGSVWGATSSTLRRFASRTNISESEGGEGGEKKFGDVVGSVLAGVAGFFLPVENVQVSEQEKEEGEGATIAEVKPVIRRQWKELVNTSWWDPSEGRSLSAGERVSHAAMFVEDTIAGQAPMERARWMRRIHRFRDSPYWSRPVWIVLFIHAMLAWFEPESTRNLSGVPSFTVYILIWIEVGCVAVEWVDMVLNYLQMGPGYFWHNKWNMFVFLVNIVIASDVVIALTRPGLIRFRYSRMVRPILMLHRSKTLRNSTIAVAQTVRALRDLAAYLLIISVCYAVLGMQLFWGLYPRVAGKQDNGNFDTVYTGFISMFVQLTTANYPFVMYPSFTLFGAWASVFFISFMIITFYLVLTVFVAAVFVNYKENRQKRVVAERMRERRALAIAFQYLDFDDTQDITFDVFEALVKDLYPKMDSWRIRLLFEACDLNQDGKLDVLEFFDLGDAFLLEMVESKSENTTVEKGLVLCRNCFVAFTRMLPKAANSKYIDGVAIALTSVYLALVAAFGLVDVEVAWILHWCLFALSLIFVFELLVVRMFGLGVKKFIESASLRFDLLVVGLSAAAHLLVFFWASDISAIAIAADSDPVRVSIQGRVLSAFSVICVLRLFALIKIFRRTITSLMAVFPTMINVFVTILVFLYFYSIFGMELFAGAFDNIGVDVYPNKEWSNFDNVTNSLITLFQLMTMANWHLTMYAAVYVMGWPASIYFITFVAIVVIIFVNLIMALIIELFMGQSRRKAARDADVEMKLDALLPRPASDETPAAPSPEKKDKQVEQTKKESIRPKSMPSLEPERPLSMMSIDSVASADQAQRPILEETTGEASGDEQTNEKQEIVQPECPVVVIRRVLIQKHRRPWERDFPDIDSLYEDELRELSMLMRIPNLPQLKRDKDNLRWERVEVGEADPVAYTLHRVVREIASDPAQLTQIQRAAKQQGLLKGDKSRKFDADLFQATSMKVMGARASRMEATGMSQIVRETQLRQDSSKR